MISLFKKVATFLTLAALPAVSFAQGGAVVLPQGGNDAFDLGVIAMDLIDIVTKILIAVAFLFFIITIIQMIAAKDEAKEHAKNRLPFVILALFLLFAIFGIITFISKTAGVGLAGDAATFTPTFNTN